MINHTSVNLITVGAIGTNCWIMPVPAASGAPDAPDTPEARDPDLREGIVFDPGDNPREIMALLRRLKLRPRYIILTHGHFDHLAALPDLVAAFAGSGPLDIAIHRDDRDYLGGQAYDVHCVSFTAAAGNADYVDSLWKPLPSPTMILAEGDLIGPFRVLHLPGHSPGSAGFLWEEEKLLISGDTLFNSGIGRTDLPGGDWGALQQSLDRLLALDEGITVCPGHGPLTSIGAERSRNWY
ncbi:MAG: MBL fold metallo-hydrolase [Spirochaetaceae bacterium]|jgi:glyoxylase-like metal-dependent hydrolase (beta-lactamase superfamily II)|nr:MBL fold metallo-hydrolase [Spirochaetaceae bacterium]